MYQSGVLTSTGDPAAFDAQAAALDAYPADDPMDRPLIRLDRARHLRDAASVIESLLHLHPNRACGTSPATEETTYRLARAAALAHAARRPAATPGPR